MKKSIYVLIMAVVVLAACNTESKTKNANTSKTMQMEASDGHNHDHSQMEMKNDDGHNHKHTSAQGEMHQKEVTIEQNKMKNPATTPIIDAYMQIKNGLVATDKNAAAEGATALLAAFKAFDMSKLSGEMHKEYMDILENAKEQAEHIAKSPIDHQREHFEDLTTDITDMIALLGTEKTLYQDHCPMANNGKGANWLSEIKEIKNPYFGSKMMKCGSITKQIN